MKVKEFIKLLKSVNQEAEVLVSSDEELNSLFTDIDLSYYGDKSGDYSRIVIWGYSGSELDD